MYIHKEMNKFKYHSRLWKLKEKLFEKSSGKISDYSTEIEKDFLPNTIFCIFRISRDNRSRK